MFEEIKKKKIEWKIKLKMLKKIKNNVSYHS